MAGNYWSDVLTRRLSRRRSLAAAGGIALGSAIFSACGGGSDDSGPTDKSGLVSPRTDMSSRGVSGGTWVERIGTPSGQSLDPHANGASAHFGYLFPMYSTLLKYGTSTGDRPPGADKISGDAAQSWEISPDGMQITLKMRPNHKFDPRPPTSGRAMTSADVKFSFDRTVGLSTWIPDILKSKRPDIGMIDSLTTPDPQTVVFKLAFPYGAITEALAYWYLVILPQEAEDKFDTRSRAHGTGPFSIEKFDTGLGIEYKKNPDWYEKGRPFLDGISMIVINEYAAALAQLEAKAIWSFEGLRQEDILRVKKDHPEMVLHKDPIIGSPSTYDLNFSSREGSPLRDVRLRHALSMLIDREAMIDTLYNHTEFRNAGLPVESFWQSHLSIRAFNWMDPRDKEFGENSKYFKFDIAEAKKLVAAAGNPTIDFWWRPTVGEFTDIANILDGMWREGINFNRKVADATSAWRVYKESGGDGYDGVFFSTAFGYNDDGVIVSKYTPQGRDTVSNKPIPGVTDAAIKIRTELDTKKRNEMIKQLQRDLAPLMPDIELPGIEQPKFSLRWPWLRNHGVFTAPGFNLLATSARLYTEYWYDASAKT